MIIFLSCHIDQRVIFCRYMVKMQKMDLLIALYMFCIAVSELMGGKTFHLLTIGSFPLNPSVAIFTYPLIFTINDIITEVFGKERARSIVMSGVVVIFGILLFSLLAVSLPPSMRFMANEKAYDTIFGVSARIAAASLIAFIISDFLDVYLFAAIRSKLGKSKLWLRNNVSNFIAQFFDTVLFIVLAFYALDKSFDSNFVFLAGIILPYWLIKCAMSVIETPLVYLGVNWLKTEKKV